MLKTTTENRKQKTENGRKREREKEREAENCLSRIKFKKFLLFI
jgi:hypothetical protein